MVWQQRPGMLRNHRCWYHYRILTNPKNWVWGFGRLQPRTTSELPQWPDFCIISDGFYRASAATISLQSGSAQQGDSGAKTREIPQSYSDFHLEKTDHILGSYIFNIYMYYICVEAVKSSPRWRLPTWSSTLGALHFGAGTKEEGRGENALA